MDRQSEGSAISGEDEGKAAGVAMLTMGGVASVLAAASCCALPVVLGVLGLSASWLAPLQAASLPWQSWLLWGGGAFLALALLLLIRSPAACDPKSICGRPLFRRFTLAAVTAGFLTIGLTLSIG